MTYGILPNGKQQFIDSNGKPLASGKVYYYIPSTTTFKNTYQNSAGTVLNTNPVVLDANGQCIAYGTGSYRQQVYDVYGNLIWDVQVDSPLTSGNQTYDIEEQTFTATSGQTVFTLTTMSYVPGTNNLVVFVDGLKQIVGVNYTETSSTVVTFTTGLHLGAVVDFTTAVLQTNANIVPATDVTYNEGGTGAVTTTVQAKLQQSVSVLDFGADPTGTNNSCDAFRAAIAASTEIYIPEGTYLIEPTTASGDFMLYLGTASGNASRNGMHIYGDGNNSIIKLGNNVGASKLLFGAGNGDSLQNMLFENFAIDLNGQNNLQANISDPLRYNMAFYFYCPCVNITFNNLLISNGSGSQQLSIGNGTSAGYGDNIRVQNCTFKNFGIAITNNNVPDTSCVYIEANNIFILNNLFSNNTFTFNLARGNTALELHGDSATIVSGNQFNYVQVPILLVAAEKDMTNVIVSENIMTQCAYLCSFSSSTVSGYSQKRINIVDNVFYSTNTTSSSIISIGSVNEPQINREDIVISNNTIDCWGNTNQGVNVIYLASAYLRDIVVSDNICGGMLGCLFYLIGTVENNNYVDFTFKNNRLDSLGITGTNPSGFVTNPCFIYFNTSSGTGSGTINSITIDGNVLFNTQSNNYSTLGCFYINGAVNYAYVQGTENNVNHAYPLVTDLITNNIYKYIESSYYQPVSYRTGPITVAASGTTTIYNFSGGNGWGNNDNALLNLELWAGVGGSTNNTAQFYNVAWISSGGHATATSNVGTFSSNVSVNFSGTSLQITNTYSSSLSVYLNFQGYATQPIAWAV